MEVQRKKEQFDRYGVAIVVVSFAEPQRLAGYQQIHRWPFVILADPQRQAYRLFHLPRFSLAQALSLPTLKLYARLLWKGARIQSYGKDDYYQAGGDFLLDRQGRLLLAHRSRSPADRPRVEKLLEEIVNHARPSGGNAFNEENKSSHRHPHG